MTSKPDPKDSKKQPAPPHPGMMGDGTEEQNLGQRGDPAARIKKDEVDTAFAEAGKKPDARPSSIAQVRLQYYNIRAGRVTPGSYA